MRGDICLCCIFFELTRLTYLFVHGLLTRNALRVRFQGPFAPLQLAEYVPRFAQADVFQLSLKVVQQFSVLSVKTRGLDYSQFPRVALPGTQTLVGSKSQIDTFLPTNILVSLNPRHIKIAVKHFFLEGLPFAKSLLLGTHPAIQLLEQPSALVLELPEAMGLDSSPYPIEMSRQEAISRRLRAPVQQGLHPPLIA